MTPPRTFMALSLVILAYGAAEAAGPTCEKPKGVWKSAFGYAIEIDSVDATTKQVKGSYVLGEGKDAKRLPLGGFWLTEAGDSTGADSRPVVQISYAMPQHGLVTAWTGVCADIKGTPTVSMVTHAAKVKSSYVWDHVIAASDYFTPQP